jgi:cold shock CspA family protein
MASALRRFTGSILNFNRERGFGFVKVDGPYPEALAHITQFGPHVGSHLIGRGVRIEFYLENHAKGLRAIRINII